MQPKANDYYYAANILKQNGGSFEGLKQIIRELEQKAAEIIAWERGNHAA